LNRGHVSLSPKLKKFLTLMEFGMDKPTLNLSHIRPSQSNKTT